MRAVIILAALVGAAELLLLLPVGLEARYAAGVFSLTARAGPVPIRLLPRRAAKKETEPAKSAPRRVPKPSPAIAARCGLAALGCLRGRVWLSRLRVHYTAGGTDPYRAAMAYARAGLALESVAALCAGRVKRTDLRAAVDFDGPAALEADALAWSRAGFLLWAAGCFCFAILREYYRQNKTEGRV